VSVLWLASYPKSGNTYLRLLLHAYRHGPPESSAALEAAFPDLHKLLFARRRLDPAGPVQEGGHVDGEPWLVKTHFRWSPRHPYAARTVGFVYVLRHPRDVLLSNARFFGLEGREALEAFAQEFAHHLGVPRWRRMGMGTWPGHVASWLGASGRWPHLFLRFEELRRDPAAVLEQVLRFLGWPVEAGRLERAVAGASLEAARALERRDREQGVLGAFGTPGGGPFVGEGRSRPTLAEAAGPEAEALFRERFGELMRLFGYA